MVYVCMWLARLVCHWGVVVPPGRSLPILVQRRLLLPTFLEDIKCLGFLALGGGAVLGNLGLKCSGCRFRCLVSTTVSWVYWAMPVFSWSHWYDLICTVCIDLYVVGIICI